MNRRYFLIIGIVVVVLAVGILVWAERATRAPEVEPTPAVVEDTRTPRTLQEPRGITEQTPLVVTHAWEGGVHRFGGSLEIPTPCHALKAETAVYESFPEEIEIHLSIEEPDSGVLCAQQMHRAFFDVTVEASEDARLTGMFLEGDRLPFEVFEETKG